MWVCEGCHEYMEVVYHVGEDQMCENCYFGSDEEEVNYDEDDESDIY